MKLYLASTAMALAVVMLGGLFTALLMITGVAYAAKSGL
jgi:hypothetical protein